jgi:hypothetical protein
MDMTLTLISSMMRWVQFTPKRIVEVVWGLLHLWFLGFFINFFCILMEVNKTMYVNNEDVQKNENFYPESCVRIVAFVVVWNVFAAGENNSVNQPSINWTLFFFDKWMDKVLKASIHDSTSLPMCLSVHGTIYLDPCNIK